MSDVETCEVCGGELDENTPRDPVELIGQLEPGDIFHAGARSTADFILLVKRIDEKQIFARRFTTGQDFVFDRRSGQALEPDDARGHLWIDCVEPLPIEHHNAFVEMDRRYRLGRTFGRVKLTEAEIAAMLYVGQHYAEHGFSDFAPGGGDSK